MFKSLKNLASGEFYRDLGLLLLRVGIGVSVLAFHHGYDNLVGGPEVWEKIGKGIVDLFGLNIPPLFPGVAVVIIVFLGTLLLILGALFRPVVLLLALVAGLSAFQQLNPAAGLASLNWTAASHALEMTVVFLALFFTGAGRYRVSRW
ncbi:MAG: DoxX family protein [Deltaproteobacteria bacterium]|nr:DoxX family protein [Deltaproteobacteria bacterium]